MRICPKCGEKFESGKFCKYCGGALVDEVGENQKQICLKCGAELSEGTKSCPECGINVFKWHKYKKQEKKQVEMVIKKLIEHGDFGSCYNLDELYSMVKKQKNKDMKSE